MAAFQLLFLLSAGCSVASARPPQTPRAPLHLRPCQVVQMDVFCSDLSLSGAPINLPRQVQTLDLSRNQVQNLTEETLGFHTGFHRLNLHSNKIHFVQPGLFRDMKDLRVLDLSKNHLNVFAHSKMNVGPLTAVESLDLSNNGLYTGMSDFFLAESPSLANLSLNGNSITKITRNTFGGASSLRKINLHNNVILEIEDGAFDSLDNLTELDLSKNSITCILDFNLFNLASLNLSKNSVEFFQTVESNVSFRLRSLDLSENKLLYFPLLPEDNVLEFLDVSRNRLQTVNNTGSPENQTNSIFNRLRYLDMSYNKFKSVPEHFINNMKSLEVLNVSNNCIGSFSAASKGLLHKVKIINLSYNSLQSLTFGKNTLPSLKKLFLQGNDISVLDHQIFQRLPSLKYLQLQQNNLKICGSEQNQLEPTPTNQKNSSGCVSFSSVCSLHFLYLSENNLKSLPADAFANTPLKLLDLSLNPGLDVHKDSLSGLEHTLVHLLLRENNISSLNPDLSSLKGLKHVDLSTNQLNALPTWSQESAIESLNLQNNNLVTLDHSTVLALERSLKTLYMGFNPLSCCDNLGFLHMMQHSSVVVPDIEIVTCVHEAHSEPVNIERVTKEMCLRPHPTNYTLVVVAVFSVLVVLSVLLGVCCCLRRKKHSRGFRA